MKFGVVPIALASSCACEKFTAYTAPPPIANAAIARAIVYATLRDDGRRRIAPAIRNGASPASTAAACGFVPPASTIEMTVSTHGIVPPFTYHLAPHNSAQM